MIEVFKTNVTSSGKATLLCALLAEVFPSYAVNFDLDDCDRILRVKGTSAVDTKAVMDVMRSCGVEVEMLE